MRLNQYIARCGVTSRRKADDLIAQGSIFVNNTVARVGAVIDETRDTVMYNGNELTIPSSLIYYAVNKPRGVVSSVSDPDKKPVVVDLVPNTLRVFPVGRLDEDSEGLIFLTNDGDFAYRMTHPSLGVEKEYEVEVEGSFPEHLLRVMQSGIRVGRETMTADAVSILRHGRRTTWLRVLLHQGRHRQIRRMLGSLNFAVRRLIRVRIGSVRLDRLQRKAYMVMSPEEMSSIGI